MRRRLQTPRQADIYNAPHLVNFRRYKIISALHETDPRSLSRNGSIYSSFSDLDSEGFYAASDQGSTINEGSFEMDPVNSTEIDDSTIDNQNSNHASFSKRDVFALLKSLQTDNDALKIRLEERRNHYEQVISEKNSEIQSLLAQLIQAKLDVAQKHIDFDEVEGRCRALAKALEESRTSILELRSELAEMQSRPSEKLRMSVTDAIERIRRKTFT